MQNFMRLGVALSTVFDTTSWLAVLSPALWPVPPGIDRVRHPPRVGLDVDLVLVLVVGRLALAAVDLDPHVLCHERPSLAFTVWIACPPTPPPFTDGSFDTSRSDTVRPSSW